MKKDELLLVREMTKEDTEYFVQYWLTSSDKHLTGMGVDIKKKPTRAPLEKLVFDQIGQTYQEKKAYFLTWLMDSEPVMYRCSTFIPKKCQKLILTYHIKSLGA